MSSFEVLRFLSSVEVIAVGRSLRVIAGLRSRYGPARWRKLKGIAIIRSRSGLVRLAEVHWYEAHGIGKKEIKVKLYLD